MRSLQSYLPRTVYYLIDSQWSQRLGKITYTKCSIHKNTHRLPLPTQTARNVRGETIQGDSSRSTLHNFRSPILTPFPVNSWCRGWARRKRIFHWELHRHFVFGEGGVAVLERKFYWRNFHGFSNSAKMVIGLTNHGNARAMWILKEFLSLAELWGNWYWAKDEDTSLFH